MKNIKRFYSVVAVLLCIVLSIPTVARAEDVFKFTTYECIEDNYTEGTWQDMNLSMAYSCCNARYDVYANYLDSIPVSFNEYDYYCVYVSGSTLNVLVFDTDDYGFIVQCNGSGSSFCVAPESHFEILTNNYNSVLEKVNGGKSVGCTMRIYSVGRYSKWSVNCASSGNEWTQNVNGDYLEVNTSTDMSDYVMLSSSSLVNTNMDLYSGYEYDNLNYVRPSTPEDTPEQPRNIYNCTYTDRKTAIEEMTILNIGVKYYDGENILGGAPVVDDSIGFKNFICRRSFEPYVQGKVAALVSWVVPDEVCDSSGGGWFIKFDVKYNYAMEQYSGELSNLLDDDYYYESDTLLFTVETPILTNNSGEYLFDFSKLCKEYGYSDSDVGWLVRCLDEYADSKGIFWELGTAFVGSVLGTDIFDNTLYYKVCDMQFTVDATLINHSTGVQSRTSKAYVDLVSGDNQSLVNGGAVDDNGAPSDTIVDNSPDVTPTYNPDGSITYVEVSGGDTNVDVNLPSEIVLSFANALTLNGIPSNGGGSSSSSSSNDGDNIEVVIEDDDYTDSALREDLKDGFGLLDNNETEELDDGFVQVASAFFESIDPDAAQVLMFGISSVVTISVLRAVFKR